MSSKSGGVGAVSGKHTVWFVLRNYQYETKYGTPDFDGRSIDEWKETVIKEWSVSTLITYSINVKSNVFGFHDRDRNDEGNAVGIHAHGVLEMNDHCGITQQQVMGWMHISKESNAHLPENNQPWRSYRYLTHVSNDAIYNKKTRYEISELYISLCDELQKQYETMPRGIEEYYYEKCSGKKEKADDRRIEDKKKQAVEAYYAAILIGQISADEAYKKVENDEAEVKFTTGDAVNHEEKFERCETRFLNRAYKFFQTHPHAKTNIYVCALGGSGKNTFCSAYAASKADSRGVHQISAPGKRTTFDFADGYHGEVVSIGNEVSGLAFSIEQFCDVLDPKYCIKANSRHNDKPFFPDYVLFNNSDTFDDFLYDLWFKEAFEYMPEKAKFDYKNNRLGFDPGYGLAFVEKNSTKTDKIRQLRRRIAIQVVILESEFTVYVRDDTCNVPHIYLYYSPKPGMEPFKIFGQLKDFNPDNQDSLDEAIDLVDEAIAYYYELNEYTITPLTNGRKSLYLGEPVPLPGTDDAAIAERVLMINWGGQRIPLDAFNARFADDVDLISRYRIGDTVLEYGSFVMNYKFYKSVNDRAFKCSTFISRDVMNKFMDIRKQRKEEGGWIIRREKKNVG